MGCVAGAPGNRTRSCTVCQTCSRHHRNAPAVSHPSLMPWRQSVRVIDALAGSGAPKHSRNPSQSPSKGDRAITPGIKTRRRITAAPRAFRCVLRNDTPCSPTVTHSWRLRNGTPPSRLERPGIEPGPAWGIIPAVDTIEAPQLRTIPRLAVGVKSVRVIRPRTSNFRLRASRNCDPDITALAINYGAKHPNT